MSNIEIGVVSIWKDCGPVMNNAYHMKVMHMAKTLQLEIRAKSPSGSLSFEPLCDLERFPQ